MSTTFENLEQTTAEDYAAFTNMTMANTTHTKQVALYANLFSTKEAEHVALQTAMKNLQVEVKNIKA